MQIHLNWNKLTALRQIESREAERANVAIAADFLLHGHTDRWWCIGQSGLSCSSAHILLPSDSVRNIRTRCIRAAGIQ